MIRWLCILTLATSAFGQIQILQDVEFVSSSSFQHLKEGNAGRVALWGTRYDEEMWIPPVGYFAVLDSASGDFVWDELLISDTVNPSFARCLDVMPTDTAYLVQWSEFGWYDSVSGWFHVSHFSLDGNVSWTENWPMSGRCADAGVLDNDHAYFANLTPCESFAPFGKLTSFDLGAGMQWDAQVLPYMMDNWNRFQSIRATSNHHLAVTAMTGLPGDGLWLLHLVGISGQSQYYHYFGRWDSITVFDALETATGQLRTVGTTYHSPRQLFIERYEDSSRVYLPLFANASACTLDAVLATANGGFLGAAHTEAGAMVFQITPEMETWWVEPGAEASYSRIEDIIPHPSGGYLALALDYANPPHYHLVRFAVPEQSAVDFILHPSSFTLSAYPNPFNATTLLSFTLPQPGDVSLILYDILGRAVDEVVHAQIAAGTHTVRYSAEHLSSGLYLARLDCSSNSITQKLVILK